MKKVIEHIAQKPMLSHVLVGLIVVLGLMTIAGMRSNFLPNERVSFINVAVTYRGASPEELEQDVVNKIEDQLEGLKGIRRVTSTSAESFAKIRVELLDDADPNEVLLDVSNAVSQITTFPPNVEEPQISKEEILNYTMTVGIIGDVDRLLLKDYAKSIRDQLLLSPKLSQVTLSGYPEEEIEIRIKESNLRAYEISFDDIATAIQNENIKSSGGEIKAGANNILIRLDNREYSAQGLNDIIIKATEDGKIIRLADIAEVYNQFTDKPNATFINGEEAVIIKVFSRTEEDVLENASYVADYLEAFNRTNEVVKAVIIEDRSISLKDAIGTLQNNAWQGILLVLIILGLFLDPRIAFWIAFKIPVALLGMFVLSNFYDLTINQVSLFGTIVVLGIIVDDGVVVAENIYQRFQNGNSPLKAAVIGTIEVVPAILASLTTTALAFAFFFFIDGQLGDYFSNISFVVIATLIVALLESVFILPVHIARSKALSKNYKPWKLTQRTNRSLLALRDRVYQKVIKLFIGKPALGIALVVICLIATLASLGTGLIKSTFFPAIDQDVITAKIELPLGTDESITNEKLLQIEETIKRVNEYYTDLRPDGEEVIKYSERVLSPNSNEGFINIYMMEGDKRGIFSFEIADRIRQEVGPIPEATNLSYGSLSVFGKPVSIALLGNDLEALRGAKSMLRAYLEERSDLKDVTDTDKQGLPELTMELTPQAKYLGLSEAQVFNHIRQGYFGVQVQNLQRGDEEIKVWLRYDESDRKRVDQLKDVRITTVEGAKYPVGEVAQFTARSGVREINHQSGIREIKVEADVANLLVSVPQVLAETENSILVQVKNKYPNIRHTLEGEARLSGETQESSSGPLAVIFILIVTIVLINYRSFTKTLSILSMLPFAFVGVAWGSFIHNVPVSIFSVLGMIALWGILINNGLVLISTYNDLIIKGKAAKEALLEAAISRFRPIVLTTITTVFGLAPLLLNNSISAQFLKPTAIAISYGLIFGMVLSLVFLPSVFLVLLGIKRFYYKKVKGIKEATSASVDVELIEKAKKLI